MNGHLKSAFVIVLIGIVVIGGIRLVKPLLEDDNQLATSDAKATKGTIRIGVDNWIGYHPLCSDEMRKRMRRSGYLMQCEDDNADYAERMNKLKKGKLEFAVATVDSYLLNGADVRYPGTIIAVIDESKGGDAIVAWENKAKNLDALKINDQLRVALTPNSPSDHLLKSIAVHFDVPALKDKNGRWRINADGSEDALKKLLNKETEVAVLWEPDVSRATSKKGIIKLLGTEDTNKLIVDILIAEREYAKEYPDAINTLLRTYFQTLKYFNSDKSKLIESASKATNLSKKKVETLLKGVKWANLSDNSQQWFGVTASSMQSEEGLIDTIESAIQILIDSGDFSQNPIPGNDPYRLTNSEFIGNLFSKSVAVSQFGQAGKAQGQGNIENSLERTFSSISNKDWNQLREIGTLKVRPIVFQSGTDELSPEGKEQLDRAVENLKHYPQFRVVIKGHTGTRGDAKANKQLSFERADAVKRYLNVTYAVDENRLNAIGYGGTQQLTRKQGESSRGYNYRLPRVELFLVAEDI